VIRDPTRTIGLICANTAWGFHTTFGCYLLCTPKKVRPKPWVRFFLPSLHCYHYPHFRFSPRRILDKAVVLDKTRLVTQRAIMESNRLIGTELTLQECDHSHAISRAINGRGNTTRPGAFFRISDKGTVSIQIAQYYLYTSSI